MLHSVKSKFISFTLILILFTTVLPMYFLISQLKTNFKEHSEIMLHTTVDVVRNSLKLAMMSGKQKYLEDIIQDISKQEGIYHIRIISKDGKIDFASDSSEIGKNINNILTEHSNISLKEIKSPQKIVSGKIYSSLEPLINNKPCQNCHKEKGAIAYLDINTGLTHAESNFYTGTTHMVFLAWAFIIILILGLYLIFNKNIYKPLQKLNIALKDVQKGNLRTKLNFKNKNEITSVYKHFNEMTEKLESSREQIEQLHYNELQRANRLKTIGELTSQTAHEINNHIAIIMSRTEYLKLECEKDKQLSKYTDDLKALLNQINNISSITRNILKYSKKDTKEIKKINLYKTTEEIISMVRPILKKKNISLSNHSMSNKYLVNADEIQIKQIITNLINNSVDAINENGHIELSIYENEEDKIVLNVKDDGCGINPEIKDEIYSPFFSTKNSEERTGLGLYIIKKICEMHKAQIAVKSLENEGTAFIITFNKA